MLIYSLDSVESSDKYDELVDIISKTAREASLYVAIHLYEKARCHLGHEMVRSNLVFDRKGDIVAVYRKPQNSNANCTASPSEPATFTTDFGVTFGVMMEEDLALYDEEHLKGVKNLVLTGDWQSELSFLSAAQFAPSWSYTNNVNLVSTTGIYSGKAGLKSGSGRLVVADLLKNGENEVSAVPSINNPVNFLAEDLNLYVMKQLDLQASANGYTETICHRSFCCEFYVKTAKDVKTESAYNLAAFNGVRPFGANHNVATQICVLSGSESNTNFERISIAANFTKQSSQYPIVQSTAVLPTEAFNFEVKNNGVSEQVTLELENAKNLINFGIIGKNANVDLENEYVVEKNATDNVQSEFFEYIFNEDVQEFVDYVWIRLRVLIVVVSIYILEMM
ncbi:unnamed protein product [Spodoptera littoralis]|uniref:Vanin C-terminal domain-containing protein n=1 Tax=Spodoptera littoralis TaxID=7109 RepID=A0A9P0N542_SPOLI|nr:unnamed protein product [Spodoptera littoralis]CAH1641883.1 unnamed protein product [Spodoptera littoralis]